VRWGNSIANIGANYKEIILQLRIVFMRVTYGELGLQQGLERSSRQHFVSIREKKTGMQS